MTVPPIDPTDAPKPGDTDADLYARQLSFEQLMSSMVAGRAPAPADDDEA